jgi:hypothetical protein
MVFLLLCFGLVLGQPMGNAIQVIGQLDYTSGDAGTTNSKLNEPQYVDGWMGCFV